MYKQRSLLASDYSEEQKHGIGREKASAVHIKPGINKRTTPSAEEMNLAKGNNGAAARSTAEGTGSP